MTEIGFYHLTRARLEDTLPSLLVRALATGARAVVLAPDPALLARLDAALWEAPGDAWLPHGSAADGDPDLQPIWLTPIEEAPNGARFLFLTGGAATTRFADYARVFDLFDGADDDAVAAARSRWKAARAAGLAPVYWQQGPRGWARKAG